MQNQRPHKWCEFKLWSSSPDILCLNKSERKINHAENQKIICGILATNRNQERYYFCKCQAHFNSVFLIMTIMARGFPFFLVFFSLFFLLLKSLKWGLFSVSDGCTSTQSFIKEKGGGVLGYFTSHLTSPKLQIMSDVQTINLILRIGRSLFFLLRCKVLF